MAKAKEEKVPVHTDTAEPVKTEQSVAKRETAAPSLLGSPLEFMRRFDEEMSRFFGDLGVDRWGFEPRLWMPPGLARLAETTGKVWWPEVEVFELEGKLHVRADLPGVPKDGVNVEILDNVLTIKGERKQEHEEKKEGYFRSERSYGTFMRRLPLPKGVDTDKVTATFRNGVLEVVMDLPKRDELRGKQVDIH